MKTWGDVFIAGAAVGVAAGLIAGSEMGMQLALGNAVVCAALIALRRSR